MVDGTGLTPPGPTLASVLGAIKVDRAAHTDAETAIFGVFMTGGTVAASKPFIQALVASHQAAIADLNALLALI